MSRTKDINRRQILKGATALGGATLAGAALGQEAAPGAPGEVRPQDIAPAERTLGVKYTPEERALLFDKLENMLDRVRARRAGVAFENDDAPALVFDPRLKGEQYHEQGNHVALGADDFGPVPAAPDDIAFAPTAAQSHWIGTGQLTSSRLTDIYLGRIQAHAGALECFVTLLADSAREAAYRADVDIRSGRRKGPLHGIPYALKDLLDTAGTPTTWGAAPYKDRIAMTDAVVTRRLEEAGAVLLGKTTLGALAYGDKWFGGITRNPWNIGEGSSGSSAGSASAVAAALCSFAIGTETMGSIVSPSARCGTVGLRPTFGRVARTGAMALCWSLDKIGPICRGVEDTALVLEAINGGDVGDPSSYDWGFHYDGRAAVGENLRVGYDPAWFGDEATNSDRHVLNQIQELGFELVKISLPDLPYSSLLGTLEVEAAAAFEDLTLTDRDEELSWQEARAWPSTFRAARFHSAVEYMQLTRFRRKVMEIMASQFRDVDIIVCPNFAGDMLVATNYAGTPSLTIPVGMEERPTVPLAGAAMKAGPDRVVPHAITLWGNMFREDQLIALGWLLERNLNFAKNRPDL
ncbi:MAG: amidase [Alphaproteobacteria bacterium]|nr:amidase [Alphaproteobacteria bacterium]